MDVLRYTHLFYLVITWLIAFIIMKPKRIKELFPITVLSILVLAFTNVFVTSLGLYQFNKPLVNVFGSPIFHLIWAGAAGLIFINYIRPGFTRKFVVVILFTFITIALEYIAEMAGVASRLGNYTVLHSIIVDFAALVILLWISEGLYGNRIYSEKK